ncbi:hypothetical protein XA68_18222 [Ophiocordyceps unilateralis]|uniref:Uncharacterized protein n=1 Tax=Ophiocordyceps unilateralis TaxID=268505 RepID=A0A2A9PNK0_OPHUN|nr:hypothetical protein XA68_18222 [Ophiocordyceps unilateralis]
MKSFSLCTPRRLAQRVELRFHQGLASPGQPYPWGAVVNSCQLATQPIYVHLQLHPSSSPSPCLEVYVRRNRRHNSHFRHSSTTTSDILLDQSHC